MNLLKRMLATCGFSALAAVGVATGAAQAQDYPTRNITMIVPFAAGGVAETGTAGIAACDLPRRDRKIRLTEVSRNENGPAKWAEIKTAQRSGPK